MIICTFSQLLKKNGHGFISKMLACLLCLAPGLQYTYAQSPPPSPDPLGQPPNQASEAAPEKTDKKSQKEQAGQKSPGGSLVPQEDMPPEAPPIQRNDGPTNIPANPQYNNSPVFNLQAQQIDVSRPQMPAMPMQGARPGYGGMPFPGNAQGWGPLRGFGNMQGFPLQGMPMNPPGYGAMPQAGYGAQPPYYGNAQQNQLNAEDNTASPRTLTQIDLQRLAKHDVVLLIDRSSSMASLDCPAGKGGAKIGMLPALLGLPIMATSRWEWCQHQTADLSRQTQGIFQQGITIVLFSSGFVTLPNVTVDAVPRIFENNFPMGGTNLAPPLAMQIGEYFRRRQMSNGRARPVMIGVITDGCPTNKMAVKEAIVEATQMMRDPQEITIVFFLIGAMDFMGERFVNDLATNLTRQGARYQIVKQVTFSELQRLGLAKAIADNLQ